jgi:hypothetical protein
MNRAGQTDLAMIHTFSTGLSLTFAEGLAGTENTSSALGPGDRECWWAVAAVAIFDAPSARCLLYFSLCQTQSFISKSQQTM